MAMQADYIWMNGKVIAWQEARVHVFSHALHYGTSAFEGIRAYEQKQGPAIFRGEEHYERLLFSCRAIQMQSPLTVEQWMQTTKEVLRANKLRSAYIRPIVFRGYDSLGVDGRGCPIDAVLAAVPWGRYLGAEAIEQGVDVQVSSWQRIRSGSSIPMAKLGGQYINSQKIVMEARDNGFVEGIALDHNGYIAEGSGENVFLVHKGVIRTPPLSASVLSGVTRDCAIRIAEKHGYIVREENMTREMLYLADEIFFTGTAAEITPVRSVDRIPVGSGTRGPVTEAIQSTFFDIVEGRAKDEWGWLTPVELG